MIVGRMFSLLVYSDLKLCNDLVQQSESVGIAATIDAMTSGSASPLEAHTDYSTPGGSDTGPTVVCIFMSMVLNCRDPPLLAMFRLQDSLSK